jgi:hypothetical protein
MYELYKYILGPRNIAILLSIFAVSRMLVGKSILPHIDWPLPLAKTLVLDGSMYIVQVVLVELQGAVS